MLTLWKTEPNLNSLFAEMNRLAQDVGLPAGTPWDAYGLRPAADVVETEAGFEIALDMPGIDPKAIRLEVKEDTLVVQADRRQADAPKDGKVHRSERPAGTYHRSFVLPTGVDAPRVEARYEAGVLTVTLPKREEAKARSIPVKVG